MKQYFGNHLGVVINTQDPENRGRVQVYIPNISPTLYKNWNEKSENVSFKTLESNVFSQEILERLYTHLPWAEAAIPFWGGSTGAPINESTGTPTPIPTDQGFEYAIPPDGALGGGFDPQNDIRDGNGNFIKKRPFPVNKKLADTVAAGLRGTGLNWVSTSGTGAYGVPNSEHRVGNATDGYFKDAKTGTKLDPTNQNDKNRIAYALRSLTRAGITGVGWGPNYMGNSTFHLDIGSRYADWGNDKGNTKPFDWVVNARKGNPQKPPTSNEPPPEAYADTRKAQIDMLATSSGDPTGETVDVGGAFFNSLVGIPANVLRYLASISNFESGWNLQEAYSDRYNKPENNSMVRKYGKALGSDYGFYQVNGLNVKEAQKLGINNLNTGTFEQQTVAVANYLRVKFPSVYAEAEKGNFAAANSIPTNNKGQNITDFWLGLKKDANGAFANSVDLGKFGDSIRSVDSNPNLSRIQTQALVDATTGGQNVIRTRTPDQYGTLDGPRTGGTMGFNSIPYVGAKVWVFFMGGDVQVPVYFGTIYEPNNIT